MEKDDICKTCINIKLNEKEQCLFCKYGKYGEPFNCYVEKTIINIIKIKFNYIIGYIKHILSKIQKGETNEKLF